MATATLGGFLKHLRKAMAAETLASLPDRELVERFVASHDEASFQALLQRHGPMVLRVCRRALSDEQDAEDVFQATFLVLAREARAIRKQGSLANWLHGVAHRLALNAQKAGVRRRKHEARATACADSPPLTDEVVWKELRRVLDEELVKLPGQKRAPLVLCYLEGLTQDEAAARLGQSKSTFRRNLERGRELLGARLTRRGVTLSAALFALLLSECAASAVPPALVTSTTEAAVALAAGKAVAALAAARALALARGLAYPALSAKVKAVGVLLVAAIVAGLAIPKFQERIPSGDLEMRNLHRWAIVLGVACVIQAPAPAQAQDIPPLPRLSGGNLIHNKSVQEDLKLGSDQVDSIVAARRKATEKYRDELNKLIELENQEALKPRDLTRQPLSVTKRQELQDKMDEEVLKALDAILKPEQTKRLKQIQLHDAAQRTGAGVFLYADVAKELQLTDKQKQRAQSIFNQSCHDVTALAFSGAPREEVPKLNKKAMDDVRSFLSDEQKKKLADLMGKPFELKADLPPRAPFGGGNAHLFSDQRVQKELKLTAEQVKSVQDGLAKVQEKYREEIEKARLMPAPGAPAVPGAGGGLDPEQFAALTKKVREENQKVIAGVLKPEQVKRLKQIELQLQGVFALRSEELVKALDLTDDQIRRGKTLVADLENGGLNLVQTDPAERQKAYQKLFMEAADKIPSLLTPDQRKKWKEMTGEPFALWP